VTRAPLFAPKLISSLREGYGWERLRKDALAGLTVSIVALPLSMALAIASGATPAAGLYTAIVGGFLVSALGGSRFQIGGPAGAFIVLISAVIARHGLDGLLLATLMAGAMLVGIGLLRLGSYIRYIPHPVLVGFTTGIAVIIFASQIHDLLGLTLPGKEPAELLPKLAALFGALPTLSPAAAALSAGTLLLIQLVKRLRPAWPSLLIAVGAATLAAWAFSLPVETIGTRFGGIPAHLPMLRVPDVDAARLLALLPDAIAIALLAGIESLLSAMVADGMSGRRHRPDTELIAMGIANIGSALFGGICVTGTVARTATNVRSGATSPVSGMLAALFLLAFMLVAAPLAGFIPLAALAGVLADVAWRMAEKEAFRAHLRRGGPELAVLLVTFLLTIFVDLMVAIGVGVVMASLVFMHRMAGAVMLDDEQIGDPRIRAAAGEAMVYVVTGPLFFGASSAFGAMVERMHMLPEQIVIDLSAVPLADGSGAHMLKEFVDRATQRGCHLRLMGARHDVRAELEHAGLTPYLVGAHGAASLSAPQETTSP
jgi:SulP family sulfate permease